MTQQFIPGFTGSPLDRTDENRPSAEELVRLRTDSQAAVLLLDSLEPAIGEDGHLLWLPPADLAPDTTLIFLGLEDGQPRFAAAGKAPEGRGTHMSFWQAINGLSRAEAAIFACAKSLVDWHERHGFCAVCGTATAMMRGGWARSCPNCQAEHFPRTDPVVIMLAEHGQGDERRVLLGRQPRFPKGHYSALAGFLEVGESIEEAVARELAEEAGVATTSVRYIASQPWPFPSSLMIACIAQVESDRLTIDTNELEDAFWATRDEVLAALAKAEGARFNVPPPYAIAHTLLSRWAAGD